MRCSLLVCLLVVSLTACVGSGGDAQAPPSAPREVATAPPASAPSATPASKGWAGCRASPTVASVPDAPLIGEVNGRAFRGGAVVFERGLAGWVLRVHDRSLADAEEAGEEGTHVQIRLPRAPEAGWRAERPLEVADGFWVVQTAGSDDKRYGAREAAQGWALQIDEWQVGARRETGGSLQIIGRAAGRLAIVSRGDGDRCSWVAGRFSGAVVRSLAMPARTKTDGQRHDQESLQRRRRHPFKKSRPERTPPRL